MTPAELAAIRERANNATPGPWEADRPQVWGANGESVAFVHHHDPGAGSGQPEWEGNAAFIAGAREWVPALLDLVDELSAEVKRVEAQRRDCFEHADKWVTEADRLAARLEAVRDLHIPATAFGEMTETDPDPKYCHGCDQTWPCPTIRAIDSD